MTKHNVLFDNTVMKAELERLIDHFQRDEPVVSHLWMAILHPGVAEGEWTFDHLDAFLALFNEHNEANKPNIYMVFSENLDASPQDINGIIGNASVLKDTTLVNIVDFILACVQNELLFRKHERVIQSIINFPWRHVIEEDPETADKLCDMLAGLLDNYGIGIHDPDEQAQEYHQVMTNLAEGKLEPSRVQMFLTFKGDTGGTVWDRERLLACLNAMAFMDDESGNLVIGWAAVPSRDTLTDDEGASAINLADFIWLCCQHRDIIYGDKVKVVVMLILFPFRKAVGDDYYEWIQRTTGLLKDIHGTIQQHITH